jgi:hypothetical protein
LKSELESESQIFFAEHLKTKRFYTDFDAHYLHLDCKFLDYVKEQLIANSVYAKEEKMLSLMSQDLKNELFYAEEAGLDAQKKRLAKSGKYFKDFCRNLVLGAVGGKFSGRYNYFLKSIRLTLEEKIWFSEILLKLGFSEKNFDKISGKLERDFSLGPSGVGVDQTFSIEGFVERIKCQQVGGQGQDPEEEAKKIAGAEILIDSKLVRSENDYLVCYLMKSYWDDLERIFVNHYPEILWHKAPKAGSNIELFSKTLLGMDSFNSRFEASQLVADKATDHQQDWILTLVNQRYGGEVGSGFAGGKLVEILNKHLAMMVYKSARFKKLFAHEIEFCEKLTKPLP